MEELAQFIFLIIPKTIAISIAMNKFFKMPYKQTVPIAFYITTMII